MQRHKHTDSGQHEFPNPGAAKPTRNLLQQLPSLRAAPHGQRDSPRSSRTAPKTCRKMRNRAGQGSCSAGCLRQRLIVRFYTDLGDSSFPAL